MKRFIFIIVLLTLLIYSCEKKTDLVVDVIVYPTIENDSVQKS